MWTKAVILLAIIPFIAPKTLIVNFFSGEDNEVEHKSTKNDPPPHTDYAKMARWLVHSKYHPKFLELIITDGFLH